MVAQVSDWLQGWSEPPRLKSRNGALDHYNRNAQYWFAGTGQLLRGWYAPLSEPVRSKPPLPRGAPPSFFELINYVAYRLSVTETGDSAIFSVAVYPAGKNLAQVSFREIKVNDLAIVTITDLHDADGFNW